MPVSAPSSVIHRVAAPADGLRDLEVTSDGAVWCALAATGVVVRVAPDGEQRRIALGGETAEAHSIAAATHDSVWVTDRASDRILRLDSTGVVWSATVTFGAAPAGIVGQHDGSAWFVEERADAVGHVDILGRVTEFDTGVPGGEPASIASNGSSVWFALPGAGAIAHARGGDSLPSLVEFDDTSAAPTSVSIGDDGCLWFADPARRVVGRVGRSGAITEFVLPEPLWRPVRVASDAADGCWFTIDGVDAIGHVDGEGRAAMIAVPGERGAPVAIALSAVGELWVALDSGDLLYIADPGSLAADIQ
ncbi:hypothetical protein [Agreia bicolorata]|uniref:Virginiamycin B lyase n=1 Tax=Agreia bicolorata TaxID=110935 RepID=A0ABR5CIV7_9MICO|nr:hypothetical protein [Agreia bicolorata]KJC65536.1 hypothetical protein TZ00_01440 [Agreia bicolorata]